jgi:quercetin dioxygenase-like cupin family protein
MPERLLILKPVNSKKQIVMSTAENKASNAIFPKGDRAPTEYFTGTAWIKPLVPNDTTFNSVIGNVVFEPGARNNWHTHPGGQILIVTDGTGYYQEKGKDIQILQKGDVITIPPDVVHWHGASPDSEFTHIAISTNTQKGVVDWLQPVTDEEYYSLKNKEDR